MTTTTTAKQESSFDVYCRNLDLAAQGDPEAIAWMESNDLAHAKQYVELVRTVRSTDIPRIKALKERQAEVRKTKKQVADEQAASAKAETALAVAKSANDRAVELEYESSSAVRKCTDRPAWGEAPTAVLADELRELGITI